MSDLEKYIIARWAYAIGEEFINDQEYRVLEDKLRAEGEPLVHKSWSSDECPTELLKKYHLENFIRQDFVVRGVAESIPNCATYDVLKQYLDSYPNTKHNRLSFKLDGWNIQSHFMNGKFVNAHTRGRGARVTDVDLMKHLVHDIDIMGKITITGELVIPNDKWPEYKDITGNVSQRASVSTAIANGSYTYVKWVCYNIEGDNISDEEDKYDILQRLNYETPTYTKLPDNITVDTIKEIIPKFESIAYEYPTDGLVLENDCFQIALRLNSYSEDVYIGTIIAFEERFTAYGTSFVALIEPLEIGGITRTQIPVQNLGNIIEYELYIGGPICFNIRSAVAPVFNTVAQVEINRKIKEKLNEKV